MPKAYSTFEGRVWRMPILTGWARGLAPTRHGGEPGVLGADLSFWDVAPLAFVLETGSLGLP